jgi:hypothetical protein
MEWNCQVLRVYRPLSQLTAGIILASASGAPFFMEAGAADTAKLPVLARVATFFRMQVEHQAAALTITASDIQRGYVDIPAASNFSIFTNSQSGFIIDFLPRSEIFLSALVTGLQGFVEIGAHGGFALNTAPYGRTTVHRLGYRFMLRPGLQPGDYAWPLVLSVRAA